MQYKTHIDWKRDGAQFNPKTYDRSHQMQFGGGSSIKLCAAPEFAGKAELPNPEELFTASLSSCLMLTFIYLAAIKGFVIDEYTAEAIGTLTKNAEGKMSVTEIIIKPTVYFSGDKIPDSAVLNDLFKKAHEDCFISNSVKTKVMVDFKSEVVT